MSDAFSYYISLPLSERKEVRINRLPFYGLGVNTDALWGAGWSFPNWPDTLTSFIFPDDDNLHYANLREMVRRRVDSRRVHGRPLGSQVTIDAESKEFQRVLDEIDAWATMSVEAYTHRRFPIITDWTVTQVLPGTDPRLWGMVELGDTPTEVAFMRDVMALLGKDYYFTESLPGGTELYIKFFDSIPYGNSPGEAETEECISEAAALFCDMYDTLLVDGVYDPNTLTAVREEIENGIIQEFADCVVNTIADYGRVNHFCQQFWGVDIAERIAQMMDCNFSWEMDDTMLPEMWLAKPEGGRTVVSCDPEHDELFPVYTAYAEWLHSQYQDHLDGKLVLPAFDQPKLL